MSEDEHDHKPTCHESRGMLDADLVDYVLSVEEITLNRLAGEDNEAFYKRLLRIALTALDKKLTLDIWGPPAKKATKKKRGGTAAPGAL